MLNVNIAFLTFLIVTAFSRVYLHFEANTNPATRGRQGFALGKRKKALFARKNASPNGCYTSKEHGSISAPGPHASEQEGEVHNSLPGPGCIIYPLQFSINRLLRVPSLRWAVLSMYEGRDQSNSQGN